MGRPPRFTNDEILHAALARITEDGPAAATIAAIAADVGAPTGSLYHRFPSRDVLIATLWLDVVETFQAGFLDALDGTDPIEAGRDALRFATQWCRDHLAESRLLMLHRREDLLVDGFPPELAERATALARAAERGMRRFARRRCGSDSAGALRRVRFALVDVPYAAVRRDLERGTRPRADIDELLLTVYDAVLAGAGAGAGAKRPARAARSK